MKSTKLILASLTAAASLGALSIAPQAQAQEQMYQQGNAAPQTYSRAQVYGNSPSTTTSNGYSSSYGGRCVGPNSFCNTYFGG
ncbi:hypothetical protein [Robbsia sp. KACC 23696]|uniref:hypothetical protein n=1 Tax=Robbsia sp. KACC 23696 TaxID=3149231 RepID=UPI00325C0598